MGYDQLACWCETNDKEKTKAIADAEASIEDLTTKIEELTAGSARLNTEVKIWEKELAEFNAEEKDSLQAISALKSAVTVLGKHHGGAFLQMSSTALSGIAASIQKHMQHN